MNNSLLAPSTEKTKSNIIISSPNVTYTPDQETAINKILDWYHNSKDPIMCLKGPAGSGKTFTLRAIIQNLGVTTACSAPTHKAVRQVKNSTGLTSYTIQKLLGLYPNFALEKFDHNNPQFDPQGKQYLSDHKLAIIDEASMIPAELDRYISTIAKNNGVKILYVGDPYQLPPIDKNNNFVSTIPAFNHLSVELTTIVRQEEGHPVLKMLKYLRNDVKYKRSQSEFLTNIYKHQQQVNADDIGYIATNKGSYFTELMIDKFNDYDYLHDIDYVKMLAYTNDRIVSANEYIRKNITSHSDVLCKDDLVLSYSTILDEFNAVTIANSDSYIIYNNEIHPYVKNGIPGFLVKFQNINDASNITPLLFVVDKSPEATKAYLQVFSPLINKAKSAKNAVNRVNAWKQFYEFKYSHLLMNDIVYFNPDTNKNEIVTTRDFDYGHGLTIHKSQGSTYKNVFIDVKNIVYTENGMFRYNTDLRNRLLYVALSRVKDKAVMYI